MKKGKNYKYTDIQNFANDNDYRFEDFGVNLIGANFILLMNNQKDLTISFVLNGVGNEYIYECIYSDI